jgi:hypothetical protein
MENFSFAQTRAMILVFIALKLRPENYLVQATVDQTQFSMDNQVTLILLQ